ncbi:hypothetical protein ANCCAN_19605 [Ancylostoma caninum]|uniref:Uncharacterized protein n=1 Tax=Ancylostoma caninum TaxID=29170 RepID=A0A368FQW7_ANCCA|nr:hypothetical protein ANCCAN_19605 [Ancylostoma caninum]
MSSLHPMYTVIPLSLTMLIQTTAVLVFVKLKMVNKVTKHPFTIFLLVICLHFHILSPDVHHNDGKSQLLNVPLPVIDRGYQLDAAIMLVPTTATMAPKPKCYQESTLYTFD